MERLTRETDAATGIRKILLAALAIGIVGTESELLLLGHFDAVAQLIPLILLPLGGAVAVWHAAGPRAVTVRALQIAMTLFLVSGLAGVVLHIRGNVEFELETYPSMQGFELIEKTLTGATPVLAPGTMVLLGVIGLTHSHKHPSLYPDAAASPHLEGDR